MGISVSKQAAGLSPSISDIEARGCHWCTLGESHRNLGGIAAAVVSSTGLPNVRDRAARPSMFSAVRIALLSGTGR